MVKKESIEPSNEFESFQNVYGNDFLAVLKHLMETKEMRFDSHIDGSYFVRGASVETGLEVQRNFESREASVFSQMLDDGLLKPFRSANNGNTFDLTADARLKAKKFL